MASYDILDAPDPRTQASFSRSNRARRALWGVVYTVFFRTSPRPVHRWRSFLLQLFGARLGKDVHVYPKAIIWAPWNLEIGSGVGVADGVELYNIAKIHLEDGVTVSQGAFLCTGTHDYEDPKFQLLAKPITVRKDAWVAADAFVAPGVEIGAGAVVAARSVVVKSVAPWMVVAGHPAKPIKERVVRGQASASSI